MALQLHEKLASLKQMLGNQSVRIKVVHESNLPQKSSSPSKTRDHGFLPSGRHLLAQSTLQDMFMSCVDSMFRHRSRSELSLNVSPTKKEFANLNHQQKSAALVEFLSKKSVL